MKSLDELEDKFYPPGSPEREQYEKELKKELDFETNKLLTEYIYGNLIAEEYIPVFSNDWNLLMQVYDKVAKENIDSTDEDLDILMIIVGDNLLDSDREGFFLSLVEVVKYLNNKN